MYFYYVFIIISQNHFFRNRKYARQNEINVIYLCIIFFFVIIKIKNVKHEIRVFFGKSIFVFFLKQKIFHIFKKWDWYLYKKKSLFSFQRKSVESIPQISQTSVNFFWNSQNGVFFILFPDMGKSCRDCTISLWINRSIIVRFNSRYMKSWEDNTI